MPYVRDKEKRAVYNREYRKIRGRKYYVINQWKHSGIIPENGDYDALYERFINTTHCEKCSVEMTTDRLSTSTTKCCDHDHDIKDAPNVRGIICHSCNVVHIKCTNTSGIVNVGWHKSGSWCFQINRKPLRHFKSGFKTIEEAVAYKEAWIALNSESL